MKRPTPIAMLFAGSLAAFAAEPPAVVNYQGVLRDAADAPLTGAFDMVFGLWSDPLAGDEILLDRHLAANGQAVTVAGGLFNVEIGGGALLDGAGPGTYAGLPAVFRDHGDVWLEIRIGTETLAPRTRFASSAFALNAAALSGRPAGGFLDTSSTGQTKSGRAVFDNSGGTGHGVEGRGPGGGGYFEDSDGSGYTYAGDGDRGISGFGMSAGGYFKDLDHSGYANVGFGDYGIQGFGDLAGAYFDDLNNSGHAYVASGDYGIVAHGNAAGGRFEDADSSGFASVGNGDYGIQGFGNTSGGYFDDLDSGAYAYVAYNDHGIQGYGNTAGGYFYDLTDGAYGYVGTNGWGVRAFGNTGGGFFYDLNSTGNASVGTGAYKILGNGTVSFVQNHPARTDRVVVYAAPEGDEVAVYTRGSGRLVNGEATVALGETFALVANPDLGLTAHVTPRGEAAALAVVSVSPADLVVRGAAGDSTLFDYIVFGLRLGFEELPIVQAKGEEAYLPTPETMAALAAGGPDATASSALNRYQREQVRLEGEERDLDRSRALAASINAGRDEWLAARAGGGDRAVESQATQPPRASGRDPRPAIGTPAGTAGTLQAADAPAPGSRAAACDAAHHGAWMPVTERVEAGDLLALDPARPGSLRRASASDAAGVVGIAAGPQVLSADGLGGAPLFDGRYALVKADAFHGAILPGDLLAPSPAPGFAMRAPDASPGTAFARALEALETGTGTLRVLVLPR